MAYRLASDGDYTFPKPQFQSFSDRQSDAFMRYWKGLGEAIPVVANGRKLSKPLSVDQQTTILVRVYRQWPRRKFQGLRAEKREIHRFEGACPFDLENWRTRWVEMFGSGKYDVYLNEAGVSGAVCMAKISEHDDLAPPKVALDDIDVDHPENRGFIQSLRDAGTPVPGDAGYVNDKDKQESEMGEALQTKLVDTLMDTAREAASRKAQDTSITEIAATKAIDMVQSLAAKAVEAADRRADQAAKAADAPGLMGLFTEMIRNTKPDMTPIATVLERSSSLETQLVQMAGEMRTRADEDRKDAQKDAIYWREKLLERLAAPPAPPPVVAAPEKQPDLVEQVRKAKELIDMFTPAAPAAAGPARLDFWEKNLPTILRVAEHAISSLVGRNAASTGGVPAVAQQQQFAGQPAAVPVAGAVPVAAGAAPAVDPDAAAFMSAGFPMEAVPALQQITVPFNAHYFGVPETSGYTLAAWVVTGGTAAKETQDGRQQYELVKATGEENLQRILLARPPIQRAIGGFPVERTQKFIREFLTYDEWLTQQDELDRQSAA